MWPTSESTASGPIRATPARAPGARMAAAAPSRCPPTPYLHSPARAHSASRLPCVRSPSPTSAMIRPASTEVSPPFCPCYEARWPRRIHVDCPDGFRYLPSGDAGRLPLRLCQRLPGRQVPVGGPLRPVAVSQRGAVHVAGQLVPVHVRLGIHRLQLPARHRRMRLGSLRPRHLRQHARRIQVTFPPLFFLSS